VFEFYGTRFAQFYKLEEMVMKQIIGSVLIVCCVVGLGTVFGEETKASASKKRTPEAVLEARKGMAETHQKMADCLKSNRPVEECRAEMMSSQKKGGYHWMMGGRHCEGYNAPLDEN
jgi:hypothetical protein